MGADVTAADIRAWVRAFSRLVESSETVLTELDAAVGDADHGANMRRGLTAAVAAIDDVADASPAETSRKVGMTLVSTVGGASGPLYGTFFLRLGAAFDDGPAVSPQAFAAALRAGVDGVVARGKAEAGDKTMYDALAPAVEALEAALRQGRSLADALEEAAAAARAGRDATVPMLARKGRASYLGERSTGHQDPGATSAALMMTAAAEALAATRPPTAGSPDEGMTTP